MSSIAIRTGECYHICKTGFEVININAEKRAARLREIDAVIANGKYSPDWESLSDYTVPEWYTNAKFGIFIHWGVYSVPAFGTGSEWYPRNMYVRGSADYEHHIAAYGPHAKFGYKDFVPMFTAEKFDADQWAELFSEAGARYIVPVAEHHDGFQMYKSEISPWNSAEMGPRRDVLGEMKAAFERRGMEMGVSSHRAEHWFFMSPGREFDSDIKGEYPIDHIYWPSTPYSDPTLHNLYGEPAPSKEFLDDWLLRCCELIDNYRPRIFYFDWWIQHSAFKPYLKKFAAYYFNRGLEWGFPVAINYKHEAFMFGVGVPDIERGQFSDTKPYFWQTDTAVCRNSWGYNINNIYKPADGLVRDLIDIVSKNGSLLLNVGPKPDGAIAPEDAAVLRAMGAWLKVNGEAIYGAKVWRKSSEGPTRVEEGQFTDVQEKTFTPEDIRFTMKGDKIYASCLVWPEDGRVSIKSLAKADATRLPVFNGIIRDVDILGWDKRPAWTRDENGLNVTAPFVKSDFPVVIKITVD